MQNTNADFQFFPTSPSTARKAWAKFKKPYNTENAVILEPQAGRGDLLIEFLDRDKKHLSSRNRATIDAIEIDFTNQIVLREMGVNVICSDFLQFESKKIYSHICMNPPFAQGAEHVLKAWSILVRGELVAQVNAETLRNPCDKYRILLNQIIHDHGGTVEYLHEEYTQPETQRKTSVEIAIIHLEKNFDFSYSFISNLKTDFTKDRFTCAEIEPRQELAIPNNVIENAVIAFNGAAKALMEEVTITNQLRQNTRYCYGMLNQSITMTSAEADYYDSKYRPLSTDEMLTEYHSRYDVLKKRAWSTVLESTQIGAKLSRKVNAALRADFEKVSSLEFTESNIYGFLQSLSSEFNRMNQDMYIEVFDLITRYHFGNRCYYKGWKSNNRHKKNAFRVGMTRFILPIRAGFSAGSVCYEEERILRDYDLAFATLDGKTPDQVFGVLDAFKDPMYKSDICQSKRIKTAYFDIRYYPRSGTLHFFPTNQKLIDRLNMIVGKSRNWIPEREADASKDFWAQYEKAEEITKALNQTATFKTLTDRIHKEEENAEAILKMIEGAGEGLGLTMEFDAVAYEQTEHFQLAG